VSHNFPPCVVADSHRGLADSCFGLADWGSIVADTLQNLADWGSIVADTSKVDPIHVFLTCDI